MDQCRCPICSELINPSDDHATLTAKGCDSINRASESRGIDLRTVPGQKVHNRCRKTHCSQHSIDAFNRTKTKKGSSGETVHRLRSTETSFDYRTQCLFCGTKDLYEGKKKEFILIPVRTYDFQKKVLEACKNRLDDWSLRVQSRIEFVSDLPAADAVYHQVCNVNFRTGKQIPKKFIQDATTKHAKPGRPCDSAQAEAFAKVIAYLEQNDEEQITINDLIQKMNDYLKGTDSEAYGFTHMKEQIKKEFGQKIVITEVGGKSNVVTLWSTASTILHDFYSHPKHESPDLEKNRILETAAKLIKNDVKSLVQQKDVYPGNSELASVDDATAFLPMSLQILLKGLFTSSQAQTKTASIGQAIVQATRPRVILAPLQLGLGVQLHHHFGSRFLVDTLHRHGFCCSYAEVIKFERSAAVSEGTDIPNLEKGTFVQYVADNVDHNIRTLDGHNTFHGMGMIAVVTPGTSRTGQIPRVSVTAEDVAAVGKVNIEQFISKSDGSQSMQYQKLKRFGTEDPTSNADVLWRISMSLRTPRPSWNGMMQMIHKGAHPGPSSVMFLPIIDLNPSDTTCVYSTLCYISSHAKRHNVVPIVTFDQPLWLKAQTIQESVSSDSDVKSIVIRLGGFHTQMSLLGAIGSIMAGSGLEEVLECVYANNTVGHMLSGKAIARAIRGHILVSGALNAMLTSQVFGVAIPGTQQVSETDHESNQCGSMDPISTPGTRPSDGNDQTQESPDILAAAGELYDDLMTGKISVETLQDSAIIDAIAQQLSVGKEAMQDKRTAKLWLQYLEMVEILLTFIKSERTGNWQLSLEMCHRMLPFLAAAGHNNYAKSLHLYLQNMQKLQETHPEVYKHFEEGFHVVRRSDRYWAGLSTDLIIEQVLMRSLKSTGGLTRGSGMTESQRLVWLLSTPACAQINCAMQDLTSVTYATSEQHKDVSKARLERDMSDTLEVLEYLKPRSPFGENPTLHSIASGIKADAAVNCDRAQEVGEKIQAEMVGKTITQHTFKKKDQICPLSSSNTIKVRDEVVHIDPQLLFQRLVTAGQCSDNMAEVFQYELCSYPPALFESKFTPREASKSTLADALWKCMPADTPVSTGNAQYILDGGALLHRVPWSKGDTYGDICQHYVKYVSKHYGKPFIVFDGYMGGPTTKDVVHRKRSVTYVGAAVQVSDSMVFKGKREDFLSNKDNKHRFIGLLRDHLERQGIHTDQATADADLLIVQTAVAASEHTSIPTILVGDDTDLLVLLCFHGKSTTSNLYFRPEPKHGAKHQPKCWSIALLRRTVGPDIYNNVLFMHAILGCDTTSGIYGIGKRAALKLLSSSAPFRRNAQVFADAQSSKADIISAGEDALVALYKGRPGDKLDSLRLQKFHQKVIVSKSVVDPKVLPPTSAAAAFHSLRVYLQVQQWTGRSQMNPEDWGWSKRDGRYIPILTDKDAAPTNLLEMVRCNCKMGCSTRQCTCRKNDLECSTACGHCRGVCSNVTSVVDEDDDEMRDCNDCCSFECDYCLVL